MMRRALHSGGVLTRLWAGSRYGFCAAVRLRIKPMETVLAERKGSQVRELF